MKIERAFSANVDNSLRDKHYSSTAEFNTCFIIHSKYFHVLYTLTLPPRLFKTFACLSAVS